MSLQYQFFQRERARLKKRSKAYKKLLGIKIPDRGSNLKALRNNLWYIVWEKNILQPKIFKYSFVSEYFAKTFALKYLNDTYYAIFTGKQLKTLGLEKAYINIRYTGSREKKDNAHKYDFPQGLSHQRKKTLRTLYRRNLRRKLRRLFKNKKMAEKYVLDKINDKPAAFFKKLKPFWLNELVFSKTHYQWLRAEEGWRIDEIDKVAHSLPNVHRDIANIVQALEDKYPDVKYDYKNDTYVSVAIKVYKKYKDRIYRYMKKKGLKNKPQGTEDAWKELIARGFIPQSLLKEPIDMKKDLYIKCYTPGLGELIFPKTFKDNREMEQAQMDFGVTGFTGVHYVDSRNK